MRWYAVLFWIWVVVSLAIFVYRRVTGAGRTEVAADADTSPLDRTWAPPPIDPDAEAPEAPAVRHEQPDAHVRTGATLADLLSGLALPHGLVPLTQASPATGPATSIVVATDSATPEQVGTALADEIEALGYEVRATGEHTALAEGPRGAVEIEIHPDSTAAADGGSPRFPTAPAHSVVVELRVARRGGVR